jgi:hypothetical protein
MGQRVAFRKALTAASATNICLSQSGTAGTALLLNGSTAGVLDTERRVLITSAGNDSSITFAISGLTDSGEPVGETLTGGNGAAVASVLDYKTVLSIIPSGNTASTVEAGTNTVGSTPWALYNAHLTPPNISLAFDVISGSVNATAEYTYDEFIAPSIGSAIPAASPQPVARPVTGLAAVTAQAQVNLEFAFRGWRLTVNSGTGTAQLVGTQAGVAGP